MHTRESHAGGEEAAARDRNGTLRIFAAANFRIHSLLIHAKYNFKFK
jgi:hypothetical protein